jgi:hypothetical protein
MNTTPRELVYRCLRFQGPSRVPRDLWTLRWAEDRWRNELAALRTRFPSDFEASPVVYSPSPRTQGDPYAIGTSTDEWGCHFMNLQAGVHGEIRVPLIDSVARWREIKPPYEILPGDLSSARSRVNEVHSRSSRFMLAGCLARPWERLQFILGSANAMVAILESPDETNCLLKVIHDFYLTELEFWASTDVDALMLMDDWGSQTSLLIQPDLWRRLFKPLYRDYCDLAHSHGKFAFMHSDGCIASIYPDLVEIGVNAVNSQLFCMNLKTLAQTAKGKITFWGEIDRQHVMTATDPQVGREAVREVVRHLYDPKGGVIAQFEMGPGSNPEVATAIYEEWEFVNS